MEKLQNHSGRDSVRVLRPADVNETTVCWKMAMENMDTPTALIFSRQDVANLPEGTDYSGAERGAYTVVSDAQPEVVLVASGSEVSTLVAARQLLSTDGITSRVVSCPSEQLFRAQDEAYRESVIPCNAKKFFLTAGLPVVFEDWPEIPDEFSDSTTSATAHLSKCSTRNSDSLPKPFTAKSNNISVVKTAGNKQGSVHAARHRDRLGVPMRRLFCPDSACTLPAFPTKLHNNRIDNETHRASLRSCRL